MEHVTHIEIENFRSFRKAACRLSPFTLVVGANNSGKSNLLRAIDACSFAALGNEPETTRHYAAAPGAITSVRLQRSDGSEALFHSEDGEDVRALLNGMPVTRESTGWNIARRFGIYRLVPDNVGAAESKSHVAPEILPDGTGISRVLQALSSGPLAQREIFHRIERELSRCVPEIEAISTFAPHKRARAVQVEQRGIPKPVPLSEVSEGTRLVLAILTIVHQQPTPQILLLEDIDRAVHPRLFEKLVDFLRGLTRGGRAQIIATCHNPYLVDEFQDEPQAVVIVEKKDGASVLSNMDERIKPLLEDGELGRPLGEIWFGGFAGGVPEVRMPHAAPEPELSSRVAETP